MSPSLYSAKAPIPTLFTSHYEFVFVEELDRALEELGLDLYLFLLFEENYGRLFAMPQKHALPSTALDWREWHQDR